MYYDRHKYFIKFYTSFTLLSKRIYTEDRQYPLFSVKVNQTQPETWLCDNKLENTVLDHDIFRLKVSQQVSLTFCDVYTQLQYVLSIVSYGFK